MFRRYPCGIRRSTVLHAVCLATDLAQPFPGAFVLRACRLEEHRHSTAILLYALSKAFKVKTHTGRMSDLPILDKMWRHGRAILRWGCCWHGSVRVSPWTRRSTSVNTRTQRGRSATAFSKAPSSQLLRRPTVISGWARNSACFASMAFGPSRGSRRRVSISPSSYIRSLLAARDGRLWIGTTEGLASWKDGKLTHYPELAGQAIRCAP